MVIGCKFIYLHPQYTKYWVRLVIVKNFHLKFLTDRHITWPQEKKDFWHVMHSLSLKSVCKHDNIKIGA